MPLCSYEYGICDALFKYDVLNTILFVTSNILNKNENATNILFFRSKKESHVKFFGFHLLVTHVQRKWELDVRH